MELRLRVDENGSPFINEKFEDFQIANAKKLFDDPNAMATTIKVEGKLGQYF